MTQRDEAERLATELENESEWMTVSRGELAALLRSMSAEIERLQDYDTRLTAVMPEDFKDWHQNSKAEWPEVSAGVITNQREHIDFYIEDLDRKAAEIERKDALLRESLDALEARLKAHDNIKSDDDQYEDPEEWELRPLVANIKTELGGNHD